MFSQCCVLI
uniref:Uncharacterized protein n=1 Tax=Anguilla anguilla TaxID=7936 RepID=A0A0E9QXY7_ANGAN